MTNAGLVIRPLVGALFLLAGLLLLRKSASRAGAWMICIGAALFLGAELYGVFTLRPFVGRDYDEAWAGQIAVTEGWSTLGLLLCAAGLVVYAYRPRRGVP